MENKSLLARLANSGPMVLPLGMKVSVKHTETKLVINRYTVDKEWGVLYSGYWDDGRRAFTDSIPAADIVNHDQLIKESGIISGITANIDIEKEVDEESNEEVDDDPVDIIMTNIEYLTAMAKSTSGLGLKIATIDNIEYKTDWFRAPITGWYRNNFVLAGDMILVISSDYDEIVYCRRVVLKPWYKRIIPSILYGKSHYSNYTVLETKSEYYKRITDTVDNFNG